MNERIIPLTELENMLDDNQTIFRYNDKIHKYSMIKADYLLESDINKALVFLFIGKRYKNGNEQMCRTFFAKRDKDYAEGQPIFALLKKEKRCLSSGENYILYDRLRK